MPVSRAAVKEFQKRKLDDYSFLKRLSHKKIKRHTEELIKGTGFSFKTEPFTHQYASFYAGACLDSFMFLLDMGLGKTKIVMDITGYRHAMGEMDRTLVVVPSEVNIEGWEEEAATHSNLEVVPMYGSTEQRWRLLEEKGDLFVINYLGLLYMACDLKRQKNTGKNKMKIQQKYLRKLVASFDSIVMDEIHFAKNKQSTTFKTINQFASRFPIRYGLTGTPFGRDPIDLWAQFYLVDQGETLGENMGIFREALFKKQISRAGFPEWVFNEANRDKLHRMIQNRSIRYEDSEVQDLPKLVEKTVTVPLARDAERYYADGLLGIIATGGVLSDMKGAYAKLRMICAGFLQMKGEDSVKHIVPFNSPPKLEILKQLLQEIPHERKTVIWHEYQYSAKMIEAVLKELRIPYAAIRGETDVVSNVKKFKYSDARVLVANYASGSTGGNFQIANYMIFYDPCDDPIKYKQAFKRVYRTGQERRTFCYHLVTRCSKSVDVKIRGFVEEGQSLFKALVQGKTTLADNNKTRRKYD